jgi:hypothetical protein
MKPMTFDRRDFLKASGIAFGGATIAAGTASADSTWRYEFASEALDAKSRELVVRENRWAFVANGSAMSVVDVSDPELPVVVAAATARGDDNNDVSVSGDVAGLANDGSTGSDTNPAGVTFFDVSDPTEPVAASFYDGVESGVHNHYVEDGYAYICENDSGEASFSRSRVHVVDVADPSNPVSVGSWRLQDHHPEMALSGLNPAHDVFVQDGLAYVAWWDAGCIVLDVTDPANPREVAHFGATDDAGEAPADTVEFYRRYLGNPGNAHYARPSPDGNWTFVGDETYPGTYKDVVIPGGHGGIRIFDTSGVTTDSEPSDPTEGHVGFIPAPDEPAAAPLRTSHNFEPTGSKVHTSWYQGGVRLWDVEDPTEPTELAAWVSPDGQAYWGAKHLVDDGDHYTVGSERDGKGLTVLDIVHETGSASGDADDWPDLGPGDVLGPTMRKPL